MHLQAVLVFVYALGHEVEVAGFVQSTCRFAVDGEVAEGCGVVGAFCQGGFFEVEVVAWAEQEDPFAFTSSQKSLDPR